MSAARYWRFSGFDTYGGADLAMSEFALYEAGVRVDTGAMLTATFAPTTGSIAALSDGNNTATCGWSVLRYGSPGFALIYDLGSSKLVDELRIGAGSSKGGFPVWLLVQTSSDGVVWGDGLPLRGIEWPGASTNAVLTGDMSLGASLGLLLKFKGPNNSTLITDLSASAKSVTVNGGAKISTAQSQSGGSSLVLNGSTDYLSIAASDSFAFGTGDFTIEAYVRPVAYTGGRFGVFSTQRQSASAPFGLNFGLYGVLGTPVLQIIYGWNSHGYYAALPGNIFDGSFHHVAVQRRSGAMELLADGARLSLSTEGSGVAAGVSFTDTSAVIGRAFATASLEYYNGYLDEVRVVKGYALYGATYTPPATLYAGADLPARGAVSFAPQLASPYTPPAFGANFNPMVKNGHRLDFQGDGFITATVKQKGEPANVPVRRKVLCLDMLSSRVVDETWSDALTGQYTFRYLDRSRQYTVISYDHKLAYRATIADSLTPEKMP